MDEFECHDCGFKVSKIVDGLRDDCWEDRQRQEETEHHEYTEDE